MIRSIASETLYLRHIMICWLLYCYGIFFLHRNFRSRNQIYHAFKTDGTNHRPSDVFFDWNLAITTEPLPKFDGIVEFLLSRIHDSTNYTIKNLIT